MKRLKNIRPVGRFINPDTGRAVNIKAGERVGYGVTVHFWLKSGARQYVNDADFYRNWKRENA